MIARQAAAIALLLLLSASAPEPARAAVSAPQDVEALTMQSTVAAHGRLVAWSRHDPADGSFRLVVANVGSLDAPPEVLPIAPREIAFDVDLGPGPDGSTIAVYSRCRTEPAGDHYGQKLWPNNATGCDLYRYDFAARTERRLSRLSSRRADEFLPTVWRGRVAFARAYGRYRDGDWRDPVLYTHSLDGSEASRRESQGTTRGVRRIGFTGLDLYGRRLALTRRFVGRDDSGTSQMRVTTLGSGSRLLAQRSSGLTQRLLRSPQFHHGRVMWTEQCAGDPGGCGDGTYRFWRSRIATRDRSSVAAPRWIASAAFILDSVWWVRAATGFGYDNVNACQGSDPPDPAARCALQRAFITY